jgi:hypothetical protein
MKYSMTLSALLALAVSNAVGLGINCPGSGWCNIVSGAVASDLDGYIQTAKGKFRPSPNLPHMSNSLADNTWYADGQHIACTQAEAHLLPENDGSEIGFCTFLQKSGGAYGSKIKSLSKDILGHGCKDCGSVPTDWPNSNDVDNGMLTSNMVSMPKGTVCTEGLC